MRIAFYAPLKSPASPVPSGDRGIARSLIQALERGGHEVALLSRFQAFEGGGDSVRMARLRDLGARLAARCVHRFMTMPSGQRPEVVFTYHVYDKAPDWIGPPVAEALRIPYLICEASLNPARAEGALAIGHEGARAAVVAADGILELNPRDRAGIETALSPGTVLWELPPFLDIAALERSGARESAAAARAALARSHALDPSGHWLLTVAMMRPGDKLESYRILAEALGRLAERPWTLLAAGDGGARAEVEDAFRALGPERVRFLGLQEGAALSSLYRAADIFLWPAVNEALGMALLEAQAMGCPVVAGDRGAVGTIVGNGTTGLLVPGGEPAAFAAAIGSLLDDPVRAEAMGRAARARTRRRNGIGRAVRILNGALDAAAKKAGNLQRPAPPGRAVAKAAMKAGPAL